RRAAVPGDAVAYAGVLAIPALELRVARASRLVARLRRRTDGAAPGPPHDPVVAGAGDVAVAAIHQCADGQQFTAVERSRLARRASRAPPASLPAVARLVRIGAGQRLDRARTTGR